MKTFKYLKVIKLKTNIFENKELLNTKGITGESIRNT